ncbi:unnamed protein product [Effrenium voratum]|uniref:Polyadenylate-binding protein n=1 Tax=Effrenium voratum TaxID=2562239 RepID=A0AA36NEQ2_9DINO|nr:unnamed protein product [Effrenium voratum]
MQRAFRPLHSSHTNRAAKTWMCCPLQASEIQEVEEVLVKLVRLLANIAISPSAGSTLASSSAVVDPLLDMLGAKRISESEELVLNVVAAITNLLFYDVPSNLLFQEDSKQLLCRLFRPLLLESYNVEALVETARALGNLSRHADARRCMASLRLDEILVILLDHDDRDLVFYACGALVNLAADPECIPRLTDSTPAVQKLAKLLGDAPADDPLLQLVTVKVLTNLSLDSRAAWPAEDAEAVSGVLLQTIADSQDLASESLERQQLLDLSRHLQSRLPGSASAQPETAAEREPKDWFYCTAPGCGRRFGSQVGDLHPDVGEATLYEAFSQAGNVASCRVCRDNATRKSLGYGYVNYYSVQDAERALETLNYMSIKGKPCRVMWSQRDPERRRNTANNIFVKGLDPSIDNKALHDTFSIFGNILSCKVSTDNNGKSRGYGFVHYEGEDAAKDAIAKVNGMCIAGSTVFVGPFIKREERDDAAVETFTNIYVKNMPPAWDDDKVTAIFSDYGEVASSVLLKTDEGKRFALVNYKAPEAAKAAVDALHRKDMRPELGEEKPETPDEPEKEEKVETKEEKKEEKEQEDGGPEQGTEEDHPEYLLYVQRAQTRAERKAALDEERRKRKEAKGEGKGKGVRLCIRNLAEEVTADKLKELLEPFGSIVAVILKCDEETGKHRGVGFVVMSTMEEATKAIDELNGKEVEGKAMNVTLSERRRRGERSDGAEGAPKGKGDGKGKGKGKGKGGKGGDFQGVGAAAFGKGPPLGAAMPPAAYPKMPYHPALMRPGMPMPGLPGTLPLGLAGLPYPGMPRAPGAPMPAMRPMPFPQGLPGMPGMPGMPPMFGGAPPPRPAAFPGVPYAPPAAATALNKEALEKLPPQQQKQQLGERLYAQNYRLARERLRPDLAGKLTGMMLELPNAEILGLLESEDQLKHKIDEAVKVLEKQKK